MVARSQVTKAEEQTTFNLRHPVEAKRLAWISVSTFVVILSLGLWWAPSLRLFLATDLIAIVPGLLLLAIVALTAIPSPWKEARANRRISIAFAHSFFFSLGVVLVIFFGLFCRGRDRHDSWFLSLLGMVTAVGLTRLVLIPKAMRYWVQLTCRRSPRCHLIFEYWAYFSGSPRPRAVKKTENDSLGLLASALPSMGRLAKKLQGRPLLLPEEVTWTIRKEHDRRAVLLNEALLGGKGKKEAQDLLDAALAEVELVSIEMDVESSHCDENAHWIGRQSETALLLERFDRISQGSSQVERHAALLGKMIEGFRDKIKTEGFVLLLDRLPDKPNIPLRNAAITLRRIENAKSGLTESSLLAVWTLGRRLMRQGFPSGALQLVSAFEEGEPVQILDDLKAQALDAFLSRESLVENTVRTQLLIESAMHKFRSADPELWNNETTT